MATLRLVPASGPPIEIAKEQVLIGRDPSCDIVLTDGSVSRRHARIERRGEVWAVVDQASANGTFLDSQRVADAGLRDGHELRFGAVSLRVEIATPISDLAATVAGVEPEATVVAEAAVAPPLPRPPRLEVKYPSPPPPPIPPPPPFRAEPAPAMPVPFSDAPPAPASSGKKTALWVGGGCCGCLVLILLGAAVFFGSIYLMTGEPAATVRAQLEEIASGRTETAYQHLDSRTRSKLSAAEFARFVSRHPTMRENQDSTFRHRSIENDTAQLKGFLISRGGESEDVAYRLVKEGGAWKISAIEFGQGGVAEDSLEQGARGLQVETTKLDKAGVREGTKVTIVVQVTGFATRSANGRHEIDLAGDLETLTPGGQRLESLSKTNFHRLTRASAQRIDTATFTTELTFPRGYPAGGYTVQLSFRDLVGDGQTLHRVPFDLP